MSKHRTTTDESSVSSERLLEEIEALEQSGPRLETADLILKLRKMHPALDRETLVEAVETARSRPLAVSKLGEWAAQGRFTRSVLEQASRASIAAYRARYFAGLSHVLEIGTGTGSDTAGLARVCGHVTTIESDPARADHARHNLGLLNLHNVTFLTGDAVEILKTLDLSRFDGLFADPARRTTEGERRKAGEDYSPPLPFLLETSIGRVRAIKVSPGLFVDAPAIGWSRQFIGYGDECLEQTLWWGASVPDSSARLADCDIGWNPPTDIPALSPPTDLDGYIVEAHAVVNRSQRVADFFAERGIALIAPDVAYGITPRPPTPTPLLTAFRIVRAMPFQIKMVREALRELAWTNRTEIKKRNFTESPESVRAELDLPPHAHEAPFGTLFLFRWSGKPWAVLAQREL